jgi:hypothetical protein
LTASSTVETQHADDGLPRTNSPNHRSASVTQPTHAIVIDQAGGPEVLTYREVLTPAPGPGDVLVDVAFVGVNYMDAGTRVGRNGHAV